MDPRRRELNKCAGNVGAGGTGCAGERGRRWVGGDVGWGGGVGGLSERAGRAIAVGMERRRGAPCRACGITAAELWNTHTTQRDDMAVAVDRGASSLQSRHTTLSPAPRSVPSLEVHRLFISGSCGAGEAVCNQRDAIYRLIWP